MLKLWRDCSAGIPKLPQLQSGPTSPTMRPQGWGGHSCPQSLVKSVNTQSGVSCLAPDSVFRKPSPAAGPGRWLLASSSALSPAGPSQADLAPMHCPRQTPHAKPGAYKAEEQSHKQACVGSSSHGDLPGHQTGVSIVNKLGFLQGCR